MREEGDSSNTGSPVGGAHAPTGKPRGSAWANGVTERLGVPEKPGNAGRGKGPQFERTRRPFSRAHPGREIISEGASVLQSRDREPGRESNGAQRGGQWGLERVWHYFGQLSRFEGRILRRPAGTARNHPKFAGIACVNVKLGLEPFTENCWVVLRLLDSCRR